MRGPLIAFAVSIAMLSGLAGDRQARSDAEGWREIGWPFPRDGWPAGRAFRCALEACGAELELYVRPKIGFCNCDSGVADDDEVDRVADLDLISERFAPPEAGDAITVAEMPGRFRAYELSLAGARHSAIGIALSRRCNLLVAVARGNGDATAVKRAALKLLGSVGMSGWMLAAVDGQ
jgi:hypothetical protein